MDGEQVPLDRLIAQGPERWLGREVAERFGGTLPFLMKVLAAAQPLSLQAHPSRAQAEAGFSAEQAAGIPLGAAHRNYKDPNHKPEILCALTPFEALYGFREVSRTRQLLRSLAVPALGPLLERLEARAAAEDALRSALMYLFGLDRPFRTVLVAAAAEACERPLPGWEPEARWARRVAAAYPGDVGVIVMLLMNLVRLEPGEALYLPAGNLHAYLEGTGVELMANSDNVLRGGLTGKHVDVPELMRVLDFSPIPPAPLRAVQAGPEWLYPTDALDFRLSRLELSGGASLPGTTAQVLLCTRGAVELQRGSDALALRSGESAFLAGDAEPLQLRGAGQLFRATPG
jgi:mannose-6-phosphate isomerase